MGDNNLGARFKYEDVKNLHEVNDVVTSEIWSCIRDRGILICYECKDFPCGHFSWIKEKNPAKLKDYERFRKLGLEEWQRFHEEENRLNP